MLTTVFSNLLTALSHLSDEPMLDVVVALRLGTASINLGIAVHRATRHLRRKDR